MSFDLIPDMGAGGVIHKVCRDFCRNEIEPMALEVDAHGAPERLGGVWAKSAELEIPSMLVPEEKGGVGHNLLTAAQVLEELASGCAGIAAAFAHHLIACVPLVEAGESQEAFLARLAGEDAAEPVMLTFALPPEEGDGRGQSLSMKGGSLALEGTAVMVGCAPMADYMLVFAPDADAAGLSLVVVDARAGGVRIEDPPYVPGLHAAPFCNVVFDAYRMDEAGIVGLRGKAASLLGYTLNALNGFTAAIAMGAARTAFEMAHRYAQERFQFGKMIIEHQQIKRYLAAMLVKIEIGRAGYVQALAAERVGRLATSGRADIAKIFCTDAALDISMDAIQVHGGIGYMKETGLEKIMRDAKMLQLLGKSNPRMELEVVG